MKKEFNFEEAIKQGQSPEKIKWLKENQHQQINEDEFVDIMSELRQFSKAPHKNKRYCPSHLRKRYKNLKDNWGFFKD